MAEKIGSTLPAKVFSGLCRGFCVSPRLNMHRLLECDGWKVAHNLSISYMTNHQIHRHYRKYSIQIWNTFNGSPFLRTKLSLIFCFHFSFKRWWFIVSYIKKHKNKISSNKKEDVTKPYFSTPYFFHCLFHRINLVSCVIMHVIHFDQIVIILWCFCSHNDTSPLHREFDVQVHQTIKNHTPRITYVCKHRRHSEWATHARSRMHESVVLHSW